MHPSPAPGFPRVASPENRVPTRTAALWFLFRARCFQLRRALTDSLRGGPRKYSPTELPGEPHLLGESRSELWSEASTAAKRRLQLGKVQNLRAASAALHGIVIPAGQTFSFWRQVGRATRARGFAVGRELREGCLVPTIGGGLCQLSGAIYNAALDGGLEIVERHAHTEKGVSALARVGRDATIFWNYVDLRLRAPLPWRLEVRLTADRLQVRIVGAECTSRKSAHRLPLEETAEASPNACETCGVSSCFRHQGSSSAGEIDRVAVLVDDLWPEFDDYLASVRGERTLLCRPLNGQLWRKPNYAWTARGYGATATATWTALRRAWATRRLQTQGAARQRALLGWDERLARAYQARLRPEHSHLLIAQNLLPFLWRDGALGGRTFDVLMVRLPLAELEAALDRGARAHPDSSTCGDFRAPAWLLQAETEALAAAGAWITPHTGVAALAGDRAILLPWKLPPRREHAAASIGARPRISFPASTLCRKGAYEVREALRGLDCDLVCGGGFLERPDFWQGVSATRAEGDWLAGAAAVVLPAFVEHRPRRLLAALAEGIPVIATAACGVSGLPGVTIVPEADADALREALQSVVAPAVSSAASGNFCSGRTPTGP